MGWFSKKSSADSPKINWQEIKELSTLDRIKEASNEKLQVIFKHSTRCSISSMALNRFQRDWDLSDEDVDLHYLDLIAFRDISNTIVTKFDVFHESPQMLIIKNGSVVSHSSHNSIDVKSIKEQF